ncbi:2-oxo-4-hydroxy-4-carboxy-5-ureidoimidazoline decarboxylase [Streptacidiphilus fuscans]|uniref:2-oxo-4-hydroxy-4-carboxy-5-ureidoimidazoline decarboxylase n=1 Tax=Streptacidiphilus fuscans TaxID=2789292 RepID=A0A931B360_9ACTN|nr:2-oxo-4-hydroxy-4-carboxy-5-ureidoimidazoline decarboxylase [Streptacidiphilus fuscans]MBF9070244.1 2-oxo-4-hydroxy-4-carboxy-5-ureidoimidazoline decarboxylase [Streptacidiphilus fuscans]
MTHPATPAPTSLDRVNAAEDGELDALLLEICSSPTWAKLVRLARPFRDRVAFHSANANAMAALGAADLHDAMAGHARIGTPKPGDATSEREQAGVQGAQQELLDSLAAANASYEEKFGHVFLICATGRTAETMLAALGERYPNNPDTEREIVRGELGKINDIRIDRLLDEN